MTDLGKDVRQLEKQLIAERDGWKTRLFEMQNAAIDLAKDNARLRALIKDAEFEGCVGRDSDTACPWCGEEPAQSRGADDRRIDHVDCPAFSAPGVVR